MNILFIFYTIFLVQCTIRVLQGQCVHPPDAENQKFQLKTKVFRDYLLGHGTYNVIDDYRANTRPQRQNNLRDLEARQTMLYGKRSCRKNRNVTYDSVIGSKSTCPWYIIMDVDLQREPQSIAKAKCSCKHCFTVDRSGKSGNRCSEVNSFLPVIKWRCQNEISGVTPNYFEYFVDIETVPVGCTCERPVVPVT